MSAAPLLWVVCGEAGDWRLGPERQWLVAAYGDKVQADMHVQALTEATAEVARRPYGVDAAIDAARAIDRDWEAGARYVSCDVRLWRHFDEFLGLEG